LLVVVSGLASLFRALLILLASFECHRLYGDHLHDDDDDDFDDAYFDDDDFDDLHDDDGDFGYDHYYRDDDFGHELFLGCYRDDDDASLDPDLPLPFAQKRFYSVQSNKRNNNSNDNNDNYDNDIR